MCVPFGIDSTEETKKCDDGFAIVERVKLWTFATRQGPIEIGKPSHNFPGIVIIGSITSIIAGNDIVDTLKRGVARWDVIQV